MCSVLEVERKNARGGGKKRFHTEDAEAGAQRAQRRAIREAGLKATATLRNEEREKRKMFVIGLRA